MRQTRSDKPRLEAIDLARGLALVAMAIYHFTWDLEFFGYVPPGTAAEGGWRLFARCIASSFLFLVGVSLVLAHAGGVRWRPFLKRLGMVAAAALAITVATYLAMPGSFIFFGILHHIAVASLLGVAFLRLPPLAVATIALIVIAAPAFFTSPAFDRPALWWTGLSQTRPQSNDYVPLFPWFGAVLLGIAAAQAATRLGLFERLARWEPGRWSLPIRAAGRHSLAFYLVHQPVLIGLIWVASQVVPAPPADLRAGFATACRTQCVRERSETFCARYCGCMEDSIEREDAFETFFAGTRAPEADARLQEMVAACSLDAETSPPPEDDR